VSAAVRAKLPNAPRRRFLALWFPACPGSQHGRVGRSAADLRQVPLGWLRLPHRLYPLDDHAAERAGQLSCPRCLRSGGGRGTARSVRGGCAGGTGGQCGGWSCRHELLRRALDIITCIWSVRVRRGVVPTCDRWRRLAIIRHFAVAPRYRCRCGRGALIRCIRAHTAGVEVMRGLGCKTEAWALPRPSRRHMCWQWKSRAGSRLAGSPDPSCDREVDCIVSPTSQTKILPSD
jgi:hypothetical protein